MSLCQNEILNLCLMWEKKCDLMKMESMNITLDIERVLFNLIRLSAKKVAVKTSFWAKNCRRGVKRNSAHMVIRLVPCYGQAQFLSVNFVCWEQLSSYKLRTVSIRIGINTVLVLGASLGIMALWYVTYATSARTWPVWSIGFQPGHWLHFPPDKSS